MNDRQKQAVVRGRRRGQVLQINNVLTDSQMGEKGFHFDRARFGGVALVVEQDVASDPGDVSLFGADGVVFEPDGLSDLVEEFLRPSLLTAPLLLGEAGVRVW